MAEVLSLDGRNVDGDEPGRIFAEYARVFLHVEDCLCDLAVAIDTAQAHCDRMQRGRRPPSISPESLASLLPGLVSDLFELRSATNGLKTHLASLAAGDEPR